MKILRSNYNDSVIRKLYRGKKNVNSTICNIPLKFARNKNMLPGDYIRVIEVDEGLLLKKIKMEDWENER